jgi:hypothetical protein
MRKKSHAQVGRTGSIETGRANCPPRCRSACAPGTRDALPHGDARRQPSASQTIVREPGGGARAGRATRSLPQGRACHELRGTSVRSGPSARAPARNFAISMRRAIGASLSVDQLSRLSRASHVASRCRRRDRSSCARSRVASSRPARTPRGAVFRRRGAGIAGGDSSRPHVAVTVPVVEVSSRPPRLEPVAHRPPPLALTQRQRSVCDSPLAAAACRARQRTPGERHGDRPSANRPRAPISPGCPGFRAAMRFATERRAIRESVAGDARLCPPLPRASARWPSHTSVGVTNSSPLRSGNTVPSGAGLQRKLLRRQLRRPPARARRACPEPAKSFDVLLEPAVHVQMPAATTARCGGICVALERAGSSEMGPRIPRYDHATGPPRRRESTPTTHTTASARSARRWRPYGPDR